MDTLNTWILMNIGCIECGVASKVVGVFTSKEVAEEWAEQLSDSHHWRQDGMNKFEVFPMPPLDTVNDEYISTTPPDED